MAALVIVSVVVVAPETRPPRSPSLSVVLPFFQEYVMPGPAAEAVKVTVEPVAFTWLTGWTLKMGTVATVRMTLALVLLPSHC